VPGLDVAAGFRPAGTGAEVGGDFYDVFQIADDDWVVVLGDVCGKGVQAALVAALVRYTVRAVSVQTPDPAEALNMVNDVLLAHGTDRFCTVLLLRLRRGSDREPWHATICSGGHPLPLLIRGDEVAPVGLHGTLVGAVPTAHREETTLPLKPGNALVLFTDGVTEARQGMRFYGDQRLHMVVGGRRDRAQVIVDAVLDDVLAFQHNSPRDDVAVVAVLVPTTASA
jgi:phosphoserine phosphatase RsbU/P